MITYSNKNMRFQFMFLVLFDLKKIKLENKKDAGFNSENLHLNIH